MDSELSSCVRSKKSILKAEHDHLPLMESYNVYTKRTSFKDDGVLQQFIAEIAGQPVISPPVHEERVPIVSGDEDDMNLSVEELDKRKAFERHRKEVACAGVIDIKAVLGNRFSEVMADDDEEDEEFFESAGHNELNNSSDELGDVDRVCEAELRELQEACDDYPTFPNSDPLDTSETHSSCSRFRLS